MRGWNRSALVQQIESGLYGRLPPSPRRLYARRRHLGL